MALKFHVHSNFDQAITQKLSAASNQAEHVVAIQVEKDTEPYVPAITKSLANRTRVEGGQIIYPGPYARFLYYGKVMVDPATGSTWAPKGGTKVVTGKDLQFSKAVHSQSQAHWFEASKAQNLEKWLGVARRAMKKYV